MYGEQLYGAPVATTEVILLVSGVPQVNVYVKFLEVFALMVSANINDMVAKSTDLVVWHNISEACVFHWSLCQSWGVVAGNLAKAIEVVQMGEIYQQVSHARYLKVLVS